MSKTHQSSSNRQEVDTAKHSAPEESRTQSSRKQKLKRIPERVKKRHSVTSSAV